MLQLVEIAFRLINPFYTRDASRDAKCHVTYCQRLPFRKSHLTYNHLQFCGTRIRRQMNPGIPGIIRRYQTSCRTSLAPRSRLDGVGSLSAAVKLCDVGGQRTLQDIRQNSMFIRQFNLLQSCQTYQGTSWYNKLELALCIFLDHSVNSEHFECNVHFNTRSIQLCGCVQLELVSSLHCLHEVETVSSLVCVTLSL